MKKCLRKHSILPEMITWLWTLLWFMLPVSKRGTTVVLWLLGLCVIIRSIIQRPHINKKQSITGLLLLILFLWHANSLIFDPNFEEVKASLVRKLSFIVFPFILILGNSSIKDPQRWALRGFYAGLILTGIQMLLRAIIRSLHGIDLDYWMYHEFAAPFQFGAIYFSWYLSIALISLIYQRQEPFVEQFRYPLLIFFLLLLLLSASKLFVLITGSVVIVKMLSKLQKKKRARALILLLILIIGGSVPIYERISELKNISPKIAFQDEYAYDTPFNGFTLRLLQWRLGFEILDDNNAWLQGTGIGSRQEILNRYYKKYNVYTGNPRLGDRGYLGYNFHNQFVETTVGTGIPGLIILLSIVIYGILCMRRKLFFPLFVYIVTLLFFMTESVLERQAGIMMFCLIILANRNGLKSYDDG